MSLRIVHRPARSTEPLRRPEQVQLAAPPPLGENAAASMPAQFMLPMLGASTSVIMMVVMRNGQPIFLMVAGLVLVIAVLGAVMMALSSKGQATRQRTHQRELYLDHLESLRIDLAQRAVEAREAANLVSPAPSLLPGLVRDPARLWERRGHDEDFGRLRVGTADREWFDLVVPEAQSPLQPHDPALLAETQRLCREQARVAAMPVQLDCDRSGNIAIVGERQQVVDAARSLAVQAACLHSPDDLKIALVMPRHRAADWQGLDQVPHMVNARLFDGPVPARRIAGSMQALGKVLGAELLDRMESWSKQQRSGERNPRLATRLLVISDGYGELAQQLPLPEAGLGLEQLGITVVHLLSDRLHEPEQVSQRVTFVEGRGVLEDLRPDPSSGERPEPIGGIVADGTSQVMVEAIARSLCPLRLRPDDRREDDQAPVMGVRQLLGIEHPSDIDTSSSWRPRSAADFLRVPIGVDDQGGPVLLDLKESAQMGMGPHGICIGATGSGKSEMLRTLVLGLAMGHSPDDLSMILVDYKGGAAFSPFADLPHVAGLIDNLADDAQLTERARASLQGEVVRRQQQLKDAGHMASITHYRELRRQGADLPPMPHLFVVIDEFGELLTAEPEFSELFLQIGRIGRSIGVHLLLSSQRIESGKLRGLDTYLSYRLGLRTFSEAESQVVLDTKDAFHLPPIPGYGYLKVDTSVYRRFRAGYVSGPVEEEVRPELEVEDVPVPIELPMYNTIASDDADLDDPTPQLVEPEVGLSLVEACVGELKGAAEPVRPVWLPPLPERLFLNEVLTDDLSDGDDELSVVMGVLDDPAHQTQSPWRVDLTRAGGHVVVMGAAQTGRTTFLRTLASSLALTHTPRQVSIYGMDLTGGGLLRLEAFPHVGGVATRTHRDRLARLVEELAGMLATREQVFLRHGVESMAHLRRLHAAGRIPELSSADVVVLLDGYGQLRSDFEEHLDRVNELIARGSSFGLHFVVTLGRWNELRMAQQAEFGTRFELRLNDPVDSNVDRKLAKLLSAELPGRVLTAEGLFAQVSLPVLEETPDDAMSDALEELAQRSAAAWGGPGAAPIRLLPLHLDPAELVDATIEPDAVPFGRRQDSMDDAFWEPLDRDQHLLVFGDSKCGKTTLLRTLARGLIARWTSDELVIAVMDLRAKVPSAIPEEYLAGHARSVKEARGLATSIAAEMDRRAQMGEAERRETARVVLLVDDFDMLDAGGADVLGPLVPHLPSARDLGLNIVLTRPVAGVMRAMYSAALVGMRDTGGSTLLMSGDRTEGQVLPRIYPQQLPPGRGQFIRRGERPFMVQAADEPGGQS